MPTRLLKYFILLAILLIAVLAAMAHLRQRAEKESAQEFDAEKFKESYYLNEDLELFCDIAFNRESSKIRKWSTDIRVEISNAADVSDKDIAEVDSVISILTPLVAPLKIERVSANGNVHIYRRVKTAPTSRSGKKGIPLKGIARINEEAEYDWEIRNAQIYDSPGSGTQTLMHEFEHVLGLEHPLRIYPYYLTIGRSANPQHYSSYREWHVFKDVPYYLSEQEKVVIKMLYSSEIKAGLHKDEFMKKMGLE